MAEGPLGIGDDFRPARFSAITSENRQFHAADEIRQIERMDYELLDFGDGRKLERFSGMVLNRPCPAADEVVRSRPELWDAITARFRGPRTGDGSWTPVPRSWMPEGWCLEHPGEGEEIAFRLKLEALPSGQVGAFSEQSGNWEWIRQRVAKAQAGQGRALRVLNLFAYTGGSTLAAASAGAEVVHIDAAQNIVDRAKENAAFSGLAEKPIRWIAEDATKFCRRELKRGNQYDAVILDPPSYGHGPKGEPWKIETDLLPLLSMCSELTAENRAFILVTCHSPGIGPAELAAYLSEGIFGNCSQPPDAGELNLTTADGRSLPAGVYARWPA
jgi:23S rRNA (cytosine1962-C5)-methyltransferase